VAFHGAALGNVSLGTILLVEDEVLIRVDLAEYLRTAGFRNVLEAGNGDQALAMLGAHPAIALVISDVRMPGATDGVALAGWLRAHRPEVKVVLVSGHLPSLQPGAADLLIEKPIQPQRLITSIVQMLQGT
jgi:DNA-binding NtrC family response regulator